MHQSRHNTKSNSYPPNQPWSLYNASLANNSGSCATCWRIIFTTSTFACGSYTINSAMYFSPCSWSRLGKLPEPNIVNIIPSWPVVSLSERTRATKSVSFPRMSSMANCWKINRTPVNTWHTFVSPTKTTQPEDIVTETPLGSLGVESTFLNDALKVAVIFSGEDCRGRWPAPSRERWFYYMVGWFGGRINKKVLRELG